MNLLLFWIFLLVLSRHESISQDTCEIDGSCDQTCEDEASECSEWAAREECETNREFIYQKCRKSCNLCDVDNFDDPDEIDMENAVEEDEFGIVQIIEESKREEVLAEIEKMTEYFRRLREDSNTSDEMHIILDHCKLKHELCAFWKVEGECEANPEYMKLDCAPVCQSCEFLSIEHRCPIDPEAPIAWKPGDLHKMFVNITTNPYFLKYEPRVLSRPDYVNGDTNETASYLIGPWVVTLESFIDDDEANRLIELGAALGYERSKDVGELKFDGTFDDEENDDRTSTNAWCDNICLSNKLSHQAISKIEDVTGIPESFSEHLQLLKYDVGQYYREHHDYIDFEVRRQSGVRIMTVFLYLNDVDAGGGTNFPLLNLTVMPKKGRALLWPNVLDSNPDESDPRMNHQALPVEQGIKYGANAWLHQRDYKTPESNGCN